MPLTPAGWQHDFFLRAVSALERAREPGGNLAGKRKVAAVIVIADRRLRVCMAGVLLHGAHVAAVGIQRSGEAGMP